MKAAEAWLQAGRLHYLLQEDELVEMYFQVWTGGWSGPILTLSSCIPIPAVWLGRSFLGMANLEEKVLTNSVNLLLEGGAVALHSCIIWH